jgi:hypothetical protein
MSVKVRIGNLDKETEDDYRCQEWRIEGSWLVMEYAWDPTDGAAPKPEYASSYVLIPASSCMYIAIDD